MKKIVFITPAEAYPGFILAGCRQIQTTSVAAEEALLSMIADPETSVAIIDERLLPGISEESLREMENGWRGVLIVLPAPAQKGVEAMEDYALRMIRKAIGYHVRLQR
jgi:vacuolar-type H+-ATPase subunit F/Vma7